MHLEIGYPAQIAQADVGADPRVDHCAKLGGGRRIVARIGRVAADENEPAILRQRREQDEALGADDDSGGLGRNGKTKLDVGDHVSAPIRLPGEMLAHGMAGDAVTAAGAQEVTRLDDLRSAADVERDPDRLGGGVDRGDLGAVFDLDAARRQMIAQDLLGLPLRLAALELVPAANSAEVRAHDLPHARTHEFTVLDVHAGAEERLDQPGPVDDVEHRRLERGAPGLVMRRESGARQCAA